MYVASTPELFAINFNDEIIVFADSPVNLTVEVTSNISLTNTPTWLRINARLPKDSHTVHYFQDGNNYTTLIINKASYTTDGGVYFLSTSNQCGPSNVSVDLNIKKGNSVHCS